MAGAGLVAVAACRAGTVRALAVAALVLLPLPLRAAEAAGAVVQDAFVFTAPAGWTLFKNDVLDRFALFSFRNAEGEVIQLSVSGRLDAAQYAGARNRLQAVDRQPERQGWALAATAAVELPPFGTVQESVHHDKTYGLTAYSYSVFGPARIALFTITFRGIRTDAAAARALLSGLHWK